MRMGSIFLVCIGRRLHIWNGSARFEELHGDGEMESKNKNELLSPTRQLSPSGEEEYQYNKQCNIVVSQ